MKPEIFCQEEQDKLLKSWCAELADGAYLKTQPTVASAVAVMHLMEASHVY